MFVIGIYVHLGGSITLSMQTFNIRTLSLMPLSVSDVTTSITSDSQHNNT